MMTVVVSRENEPHRLALALAHSPDVLNIRLVGGSFQIVTEALSPRWVLTGTSPDH